MSTVRELAGVIKTIFETVAVMLENRTPKPDTRKLEEMLERPKTSQTAQPESESATATSRASPPLVVNPKSEGVAEATSHIAPPPNVSIESYCLECLAKHLATAKVLTREALQRAEKGEDTRLVVEKVRGAYEEITGAEDDSKAIFDEDMRALNAKVREVRKWIFGSNALIAPNKEKVAELLAKVGELESEVYKEMEKRAGCPTGVCEIT